MIKNITKILAALLCLSIVASAGTPFVHTISGAGSLFEPFLQTTLYLDPPTTTVTVCTTFTIAINVEDVTDLIAWQAEIDFDPNLVEVAGYSFGPFLMPPTFQPQPTIDNVAGYILAWDAQIFYPPGQSGSGTLFYIEFHCKGAGQCDLTFSSQNTVLMNSFLEVIPFTAINGHVNQIESLYLKPGYPDYAPSGMPDFSQKQDAWTNPWPPNPGSWSYCGPTAVANSLWWFDSKYEPNPAPQPIINDGFSLVQSYNSSGWDDHDPQNVVPFIHDLAWYMDTDGQRTGLPHCGTDVFDMQAGIAQYLSDKGVNPLGDASGDGVVDNTDLQIVANAYGSSPGGLFWDLRADVVHDNTINMKDTSLVGMHYGEKWGKFYEKTVPMPDPSYLAHEIEMCEDVVLLLGFWQELAPGYFVRIGGHFVTAHGVNETTMMFAISDPFTDNAENGGLGQVIPPAPHGHPPVPPDSIHNDAAFVSHDYYVVAQSPSPGGHWGLPGYNISTGVLQNAYGQNTPHNFTEMQEPYMGLPVYVEIEYAVDVSCRGPMVVAGSDDGYVYALDYIGNLLWSYNTQAPVVSVAISEWGDYVVAGALNTGLFVFNNTGYLLWSKAISITDSYGPAWAEADSKTVGISADGSYIVAATLGGLYLYDNLGNEIWHYAGGPDPIETCVEISPDGRYIVCTSYTTGQIHFFSHLRDGVQGWQSTDVSPLWTQMPLISLFNWVAIDGCGKYVAFTTDLDGDYQMEVYLFDRAGTQIWSWEFDKTGFVRVDMPWDGRSVVAVNDDFSDQMGTQAVYFSDMYDGIAGWQSTDGTPQWIFVPSPSAGTQDFYTVAISPDGEVIATGPATTNIYLLDNTGSSLQTLANGALKTLDLTFTGEYGVAGELGPAIGTGTIDFFSKTRSTILWSFTTAGTVESVAIQKKYPCLMPFPYHDVQASILSRYVTSDGKPKKYVCQGYSSGPIKVAIANNGYYTETVELTLYAYSSSNNTLIVINSTVITIPGGAAMKAIDVYWQVPSWLPYYGNYTLYLTVGAVSGENNLADNELIDSGLVITGPGDINGDRKCEGKDLAIAAKGYDKPAGDPKYSPDADIVFSYRIDGKDIAVVAKYYDTKYP